MGLIAFRKPPTTRIAPALAAAATTLFGWLGQPSAEVIHYTIADAVAAFSQIPGALVRIEGSFDFDPATQIQSNVRLSVTGSLMPGDYAALFPRKAANLPSSCKLCDIFSGYPAETGGAVRDFRDIVTISFTQPLDGTSAFVPIRKVLIDSLQGGTPCSRAPGCQTVEVTGGAQAVRGRELPPLEFEMVRSAAAVAANCLRGAEAHATVTPLGPVEQMEIEAKNLPPNTEFNLFVIQAPNSPFGLSWYQGDLESNARGAAQGTFTGRFNVETFIVAPGVAQAPSVHNKRPFPDASSNPATAPVHTFHLGLWFNDPADAARAGCPNSVTPFNGRHHAGIQALSTRNSGKLQGPLRQLKSTVLGASR